MQRVRVTLALLVVSATVTVSAQPDAPARYRTPPQAIVDILDAPPLPDAQLSPTRDIVALLERRAMPPLAELAQPMLRLAGSRINPQDEPDSVRSFWYAHRINEPILLIHGEMDDNSGTFPVQSDRLFAAVKGHGGTARYVTLPYEAHGYAGRESVLHTVTEMVGWAEKYLKATPAASSQEN